MATDFTLPSAPAKRRPISRKIVRRQRDAFSLDAWRSDRFLSLACGRPFRHPVWPGRDSCCQAIRGNGGLPCGAALSRRDVAPIGPHTMTFAALVLIAAVVLAVAAFNAGMSEKP
jgi:hypothetical protein